jgi:hypothetical protein
MSQQDLRTFTSFGEKLLNDHNDSFRKELTEKFEIIATKLTAIDDLTDDQKAVLGGFLQTGRTIVTKSARILP